MKENICAVVVTRNRKKLFFECIDSLLKQKTPVQSIVVVDNNSDDGTKETFEIKYNNDKRFHYIYLPENKGPSGGFYTGIKKAYEIGSNWIWVMDDDCEPKNDALKNLIDAKNFLKKNKEKIGFLASSVYLPNGDMINVPMISNKLDKNTGEISTTKYLEEGILRIKNATFVSIFYSRDFIKNCGYPIKEMFIWGDDTEFSYRASNKYDCFLVGKSKVIHKKPAGKLITIHDEKRNEIIKLYYLYYRNNTYALKKFETRLYFITRLINWLTIKPIKCLFSKPFGYKKAYVMISGTIAGLFFNPKVEKP